MSVKIMLLGAVVFLAGWRYATDGSLPATVAFMVVGPVMMLIGLLMGNQSKEKKDHGNDKN